MKFQIKNRFDLSVIFECEADSMKIAVKLAIEAKADLSYANLISADLRSANLRSANLSYADLSSADFSYANLRSADLSSANLSYSDLRSADLSYADLNKGKLDKNPIFIYGLNYDVLITKQQINIGCEIHKVEEWESFDDRRILAMDGRKALEWWRIYKPIIMALQKEHIN